MASSFFLNKNPQRNRRTQQKNNGGVVDHKLSKPKNTYQEPTNKKPQTKNSAKSQSKNRKLSTMRAYRDTINKIKAIQIAEEKSNVSSTLDNIVNNEVKRMTDKQKALYKSALIVFSRHH